MIDVCVQMGHCFRRRGSTGTTGHRGTEQEFVSMIGPMIVDVLKSHGLSAVTLRADAPIPKCRVLLALHQDGSPNPSTRGASVGYPSHTAVESKRLGDIWKALYQLAGFEAGFRRDNYTAALSGYYAWRRSPATANLLIEHGFATNRFEENWMWDKADLIAATDAAAVMRYLGVSEYEPNEDDPDMDIINDPEAERMFAQWTLNGTTIVREYLSYRGVDVGTVLPGISIVIDEQIKSGQLLKA